ncbi:MAG TPA: MYXO-CTERM sorting domain-containing protein [Polyangia bacterium]|nr:MYXO-CTERM sorting domain-containing protein [Polyangia bacterium]
MTGEFVTYVADFKDGHAEWWHAVRTPDGREVRLDFDTPPGVATGTQVRIHGEPVGANQIGDRLHVRAFDVLPRHAIGAAVGEPDTYAAPATDTYALVLVDLGKGVNVTTASGQTTLFAGGPTDKSFANYYKEVSYGKYQVTGDVIGPFPYTMTDCNTNSTNGTTGMYKAIEPMITGTYNHLIYYFNETSLCQFGGLGEEGSVSRPAKRTWMNGSLTCVVLMQEPGHNLGLMHANTIKCGTSSFSTNPGSSCTITEYGSGMSTMGGGCKQFNAYERWYMQWLSGCNGVRVPATGTFNLQPLETNCSDGSGIQVLQVPFPATLTVSDPQSTGTAVSLNNYYVELRTAGGVFDTYSTSTRGTVFSGPTVFVYVSDNVHPPSTTATGRGQTSVWTELLNMSPSGTAYTGLTAAGQSFVDPAGGPTIKLESISATGASVSVTYPNGGTGSPTCIDGTPLAAPGPSSCTGAAATGTGGTTGTGAAGRSGTSGTGGTTATGAAGRNGTTGTGGTNGSAGHSGSGGTTSTGGTTGVTGSGGARPGSGGTTGATGGNGSGGMTSPGGVGTAGSSGTVPGETLTGGCSCSTDPAHPLPRTALWLSLAVGLALARVRRRNARRAA